MLDAIALGHALTQMASIFEEIATKERMPFREEAAALSRIARHMDKLEGVHPETVTRETLKNSVLAEQLGRHSRVVAYRRLLQLLVQEGLAVRPEDFLQRLDLGLLEEGRARNTRSQQQRQGSEEMSSVPSIASQAVRIAFGLLLGVLAVGVFPFSIHALASSGGLVLALLSGGLLFFAYRAIRSARLGQERSAQVETKMLRGSETGR